MTIGNIDTWIQFIGIILIPIIFACFRLITQAYKRRKAFDIEIYQANIGFSYAKLFDLRNINDDQTGLINIQETDGFNIPEIRNCIDQILTFQQKGNKFRVCQTKRHFKHVLDLAKVIAESDTDFKYNALIEPSASILFYQDKKRHLIDFENSYKKFLISIFKTL